MTIGVGQDELCRQYAQKDGISLKEHYKRDHAYRQGREDSVVFNQEEAKNIKLGSLANGSDRPFAWSI